MAPGMALLEGVALLEEVCHCGGGLRDPPPSCLEDSLLPVLGPRCRSLYSFSSTWSHTARMWYPQALPCSEPTCKAGLLWPHGWKGSNSHTSCLRAEDQPYAQPVISSGSFKMDPMCFLHHPPKDEAPDRHRKGCGNKHPNVTAMSRLPWTT